MLGETQQVAGETFTKTMATLSQTLLPGLLEMQRAFYQDPSKLLTDRVRALESGSKGGTATGADLLSSISHTGTADRRGFTIDGSQTQLNVALARLDRLERENASLRQEIGELKSRNVIGPLLDVDMIPRLLERIVSLELKDNAQIVVSGLAFGGVQDCKHFLTTQMCFDPATVFLGHDMVSLINNILKEGKSSGMSEVLTQDHNAIKGGFGNISVAALYASMQHAIPGPLAGSGGHPLPRINTFEKWDQHNGDTGIRYEIQRGVEHEVNQTLGWINSQLSTHPKAHILFSGLLREAQTQWQTVATFITDQRGVCMQQCGDQEESWKYPCEVIKELLLELFKVRGVGALRSNLKLVPIDDAARMMWGVLRCHQLMREFISHKFMGHPLLSGYSLNHLFRHRLTPKNLNPLTAKVEVIQRE